MLLLLLFHDICVLFALLLLLLLLLLLFEKVTVNSRKMKYARDAVQFDLLLMHCRLVPWPTVKTQIKCSKTLYFNKDLQCVLK